MKNFSNNLIFALLPLCIPAVLSAQAVINNNGGTSTSGNYSSSSLDRQSDKLFDVDSDMINPGEGIMAWKGKIFSIEDTKIIRERFERYLTSPIPAGSEQDYEAQMQEIFKLLEQRTTQKKDVNKQMIQAVSMLLQTSEFEVDGKQSLVLAKQVYKACRQRAELTELGAWQRELDRKQNKLQMQIDNREKIRRDQESQVTLGRKGNKTSTTRSVAPTPEHTFLISAAAENKAAMASMTKQTDAINLQAKLEFQSTMVGFLIARRYDHALLASAFYRVLFKGSHHGIKVGEKEFADVLPISNFVPSLESFDQLAREMKEETRKSVKSATSLWENDQKYHAYKQLFSAFFVGENELCVAYFPQEQRAEFMKLGIQLRELQRQSENKDIGVIEETLAIIHKIAPDFPASEITGKVRAAKQASHMAILRARQAALTAGAAGTPEALAAAMDSIEGYITRAAEFWPQNPEIPKFMEEVLNRTNVMAQLTPEFDKLVAAGKKREIFNRRAEFTAALMQDAVRRKRFEEIVSHVATIETALAQINMLLARKDDMIAWDMLITTEQIDPTDDVVLQTKARTAARVSRYAQLLDTAAQDEKNNDLALALNRYLAAQDLNPTSEICRSSVERIAGLLLSRIPVPATGKNAETRIRKNSDAGTQETDDDFDF